MLRILAASAAALTVLTGASIAASVKDGYSSPTVTVPYASVKPTIDGTVGDQEWQGAASFNALQTVTHDVSPRQARFWMMWDEDNLYVAMRSPMRPGERVIQSSRRTDKDINVVGDDSYEIWVDVGSKTPDGQPTFFQFLCNFAGARYDVLQEPAVGNSRVGWTAGWQPKNRITADGTWEMEVAIPRKSIYKTTPFADGDKISCLIARNFKRPWEQNSFEGTGIFNVRETYSHYVLSKTECGVHLLSVADPGKSTLGLSFEAFGGRDEELLWSFASDGGVTKDGKLSVKKGELAQAPPMLDLDKPGTGSYRVRVTSADGKATLLDWCANRKFGDLSVLSQTINDKGDKANLNLTFNPVSNYVRVNGDFIGYDARASIDKCVVTVADSTGRQLALQNLKIDQLAYVSGVIKLDDIPFGDYKTTLTCYGSDGTEILKREQTFSKKDHAASFPWWNTTAGNIEKVIEPWTPVSYRDGNFNVWGRQMHVGTAGLPAQVVTQKSDLMARPAELVLESIDGRTVKAVSGRPQAISAAEHRAVVTQSAMMEDVSVRSNVTVEFDGMYKVDMVVAPKRTIKIKSLKVVIPLKNEAANYIYATGEGIRYGFDYGFIDPIKTGRIWSSTRVDSQPMVVGSFIPYLWIGSPQGGLAWFADSDEGWVPNNDVPAIELRRDTRDSTDLVLNLISSDTMLDRPRKISFAFQASPVKPMHEKWRMDSWWCGDTFRDFSCHQNGDIIWSAIPFTLDTAKCKAMVDAQHSASNAGTFGIDKYRANAVPYFIHMSLPSGLVPEVSYFGDEWQDSISGGLYYGKTLQDYMIYNLSKWCKETGIDGYYIDNVSPLACDNIDAGRGYRLPNGKIQPTYQMFDTRRYFLRMRAAFEEQGKVPPKIVIHMTNNMITPWIGAADIAYDGEEHVIYPEMGKDFMDFWPLDRIRSDFPGQWGVAVNFMHEYQGPWEQANLKKAMRAYTGEIILHDVLPSGNANGMNQELWKGRDRFGIETPNIRFIGYWETGMGLSTDAKDVKLAGWVGTAKVLVAVVNFGEKTSATVKLDADQLGLLAPAQWTVYDAETQEKLSASPSGTITLPVDRHDYRQIIVESEP